MTDDGLQLSESYLPDAGESASDGDTGLGAMTRNDDSDDSLVSRARRGDRDALGTIFRRHQRRLFQVAFGIMRDVSEAEDVVQETFIRVCENFRSFKGDCAFTTWTHRIAVNLSLDAMRRLKRRKESASPDDISGDDSPCEFATDSGPNDARTEALRRELAGELSRALDDLGDSHRTIFCLREVDGLSYEELAATLHVPKGTVMSRLFHARRKMQLSLGSYVDA